MFIILVFWMFQTCVTVKWLACLDWKLFGWIESFSVYNLSEILFFSLFSSILFHDWYFVFLLLVLNNRSDQINFSGPCITQQIGNRKSKAKKLYTSSVYIWMAQIWSVILIKFRPGQILFILLSHSSVEKTCVGRWFKQNLKDGY